MNQHHARLRCINPSCGAEFPVSRTEFACAACADLLDVVYDWDAAHRVLGFSRDPGVFAARLWSSAAYCADNPLTSRAPINASGVWRFRELLPFFTDAAEIVTIGEGRTILQRADDLARATGFEPGALLLQYEGFNPSGSFKDNGMAGAFTHARMVGAQRVICASTGNTSASMGLYAASTGIPACVLVGSGKIAMGKLSQALDFGARTLQLAGDFDACLKRVQQIALGRPDLGVYLMNSVNPFRIEGQKTVMYRVLEALGWDPPEWIVVPGGNLGNASAFAKALTELKHLGMIPRLPRLAIINAAGARTFHRIVNESGVRWDNGNYDRAKVRDELARMDRAGERAHTIASAIEIGRPVNLPKALRALEQMNGVVRAVNDETILENKALIGRHGYSCEPAGAASLAGARLLRAEGVIAPGERAVCIITGHGLKDPDASIAFHTGARHPLANPPQPVSDDLEAILAAMN